MRPNFLLLAVACVFLAMAAAIWTHGEVIAWHAVLAFIGGLAAHACVNAINEYQDVKSGLDFRTNRTPFSGGSGTLIQDTNKAPIVLWTTIVTALIAVVIGVYFAITIGWVIVLIGVVGLVVIFTYTRWLNRQPLLCLLSPGFWFRHINGAWSLLCTHRHDHLGGGCLLFRAFLPGEQSAAPQSIPGC